MYYIRYTNLTENYQTSLKIDDLKDIYTPSSNCYKTGEIVDAESSLLEKLDYGVSILVPCNNGEDYVYQYNRSVLWDKISVKDSEMLGKKYGEIFKGLKDLKVINVLNKVYNDDCRVDVNVDVFKDSDLFLAFSIYYVKEKGKVYSFSQDLTKYFAIKYEEEKIFNSSNEGLITINKNKEIVRFNKRFLEMFNINEHFSKDDLFDLFLSSAVVINSNENVKDIIKEFDKLLNRDFSSLNLNFKLLINGGWKYFHVHAIPIIYRNQKAAQIRFQDISSSKEDEIKALNLQKNLEIIQSLSNTATGYVLNGEWYWTPEIYNILEREPNPMDNHTYLIQDCVISRDLHILEDAIFNLSPESPNAEFVVRVQTGLGGLKYLHILFKASFNGDGVLVSRAEFYQDVTEQTKYQNKLEATLNEKEKYENRLKISVRQTEDFAVKLQKALNEKEELLREVHDRVKNNLQLILSFLNLELRYNPDDPELILQKTRNRIEAMAIIHSFVYESVDGDTIDTKTIILKSLMTLFYNYRANNIQENYYVDSSIELSTEKMIPLGLILVELAFNSINYAFPNGEEGEFTVELNRADENSNVAILKVFDTGVGLSEEDALNSPGFLFIKTLISQLEGSANVLNIPRGFGVSINFPID